jgi:hypothetical protein
MRPTNKTSGCINSTSADCILWTGPNISCIGIEAGMSLTEVEEVIACKICDLSDQLDLSEVNLDCLIAEANIDPEDKNLKLILELILENQCTLKELIDNINSGGDDSCCDLNLNLKCIRKFDEFENEIPQDLNQTLQSIVNELCDHKDAIDTLEATVDDLQDQIDNLPDPPDPYEEPVISTCVATARPLSEATELLAADYCAYKAVVGTPVQVQGAISQQCDNLNQTLGSEPGWNAAPQNLAQSFSNLWVAYCDLLNRVRAIEQTCCAPSCDKIKIGFTTDFDFENEELTMNFITGAGTLIPSGFVDCGTTLRITDKNGLFLDFAALDISQGSSVGPLSIVGLASGTLVFNFKTKFCLLDDDETVILTCQDCVVQEVEYNNPSCCTITNIGTETVDITYSVPITQTTT